MSLVKQSRWFRPLAIWMGVGAGVVSAASASEPLKLLPENPHYFLFRGQHYVALLNPNFNFTNHLNAIAEGKLRSEITLPAGKSSPAWFDTKTGALTPATPFTQALGTHTVAVPAFEDDIALVIRAVK